MIFIFEEDYLHEAFSANSLLSYKYKSLIFH